MSCTIGSLFTGYGGLDMGVAAALGESRVAWTSDIDKGACKAIAHHHPDAPNLGDITTIDWATVEPVDVITGGSPCQDLSAAGQRAGMTTGTRSNLWVAMREAIAILQPRLVVWENVRGAYSAPADSGVEPCPGCVGDRPGVSMRALGRVLGDLSDIGYNAVWHGLRAADVGAPHARFRVFVVARLADADVPRPQGPYDPPGTTPTQRRGHTLSGTDSDTAGSLLPTPSCSDTNGAGLHGDGGLDLRTAVTLLPTPVLNDMGKAYTPDEWDAWTDKMKAKHGNGNGHGKSLEIEAARLLPTPQADTSSTVQFGKPALEAIAKMHEKQWGDYAAAIQQWEHALGRPAPDPTEPTGRNGAHRLSPRFTEWMMGLPDGWITDVPGITRNEALKACGNGVVPQQAAEAVRFALTVGAS